MNPGDTVNLGPYDIGTVVRVFMHGQNAIAVVRWHHSGEDSSYYCDWLTLV